MPVLSSQISCRYPINTQASYGIKQKKLSGSITSWQTDGEKVETVTFYLLGLKITGDSDCSQEILKNACFLEGKL